MNKLYKNLTYTCLPCDRHTDWAEFAEDCAKAGAKGQVHAYDLEGQDGVVLCSRELSSNEEAGLAEFVMEDN